MEKRLQAVAPWRRNMGIELTWVPKKWVPLPADRDEEPGYYDHLDWDKYEKEMRARLEASGQRKQLSLPLDDVRNHHYYGDHATVIVGDVTCVHQDPGCVETPTRILVSWDDAKGVYKRLNNMARYCGMVPYEEHQETGMGHIHTTVTREEAWKIERDLIERPYLPWVFASPNQAFSCSSFGCGGGSSLLRNLARAESGSLAGVNQSKYHITALHYNRSEYVNDEWMRSDLHLEWRAFDAALDWQEEAAHIAFLQNYYEFCQKQTYPSKGRGTLSNHSVDMRQSYATNMGKCADEFKDLVVHKLSLPWAPYKDYLVNNLEQAFAWGGRP